jgi:putative lipoprotein
MISAVFRQRPFATLAAVAVVLGPVAREPVSDGEDEAAPVIVAEIAGSTSGVSVVRGFLVLGPEVRSIKPCAEDRELWVIPTGDLSEAYDALSGEPYAPVFVEVEALSGPPPETGFGADYEGLLTVRELRRAAPAAEGFGCSEDVSTFAFRASGEEPFWHLRVTPSGIVLSTPDIPETVFEPSSPTRFGEGWAYESLATGPEAIALRAVFEAGPCNDSMVGAFFTWTARVEIGDDVRTGCAWEGRIAPNR